MIAEFYNDSDNTEKILNFEYLLHLEILMFKETIKLIQNPFVLLLNRLLAIFIII
uniref:Uncharacterized protein n=1 Tax=Rhizophagus irregularis (strain DAOM 181602 / DAOM 197198 / MUCL 43194) TaxID=747089 RepID=U9U9K8_RHIID